MPVEDEIASLRAENDLLRERVRQLEEMFAVSIPRRALGLRPLDSRVLMLLLKLEVMSTDTAMVALYSNRPENPPDSNIIGVIVHRLRGILAPRGIKIETLWGTGYFMTKESKRLLTELMERENAKADNRDAGRAGGPQPSAAGVHLAAEAGAGER